MATNLSADQAPLEVFYMEILDNNVDARLGKMVKGQVVVMDRAKAVRYLSTRMARQTDEGAFEAQQEKKKKRSSQQQETFARLNAGYDAWDVSTYRDVLTAPESGLRVAHERGIPLVNIQYLRDENGDVLAPDADIEDILDAREMLHQDVTSPFASHDRSSVFGGGSPLNQPAPLSPRHREMMERVAAQELYAQRPASESFVPDDEGAQSRQRSSGSSQSQDRGERGTRAQRRSAGRVSDDAKQQAGETGAKKPEPASGEQVAN